MRMPSGSSRRGPCRETATQAPPRRPEGRPNDRAALSWDVGADVAQLVEHFTRNEGVRGSNPRVGSALLAFITGLFADISSVVEIPIPLISATIGPHTTPQIG